MMKKFLWIGLAVVLVGVILYSNIQQQKTTSDKRTVYAVLPLTGAFAEFGKNIQKDIETFTRDKNYSFNIKYLDSETKPEKAITALQQATLSDDKPIVISAFSTIAVSLAPFVEQKGGFLFGVSTITHTNTKNFLQLGADAMTYVNPVVNYLKKGNYQNVALFFIQDEYGLKQRNFLTEELKNTPAQIKNEIAMSLTNANIHTEVYKIMTSNPDAILIQGLPSPGYLNIIRELKTQNYKGVIIADASLRQPWVLSVLGENAEGVYFPVLKEEVEMEHTPKVNEFRKYLKENALAPVYLTFETYDALNLIQYTLDKNLPFEQKTYENIKDWESIIETVKFKGETAYGHIYMLATSKDGKIIPVE